MVATAKKVLLMNTVQCTGQTPTEDYTAQNVSQADDAKPCLGHEG